MKNRNFADDITILDRYQTFSGEILRLALLGVGAMGFLITTAATKQEVPTTPVVPLLSTGVRPFLILSFIAFGLSVLIASSILVDGQYGLPSRIGKTFIKRGETRS